MQALDLRGGGTPKQRREHGAIAGQGGAEERPRLAVRLDNRVPRSGDEPGLGASGERAHEKVVRGRGPRRFGSQTENKGKGRERRDDQGGGNGERRIGRTEPLGGGDGVGSSRQAKAATRPIEPLRADRSFVAPLRPERPSRRADAGHAPAGDALPRVSRGAVKRRVALAPFMRMT